MSSVETGAMSCVRPFRSVPGLLAISLAGLALTACVSTPVRTPDTRLPEAYEAPSGVALAPGELQRWWTAFDDAELTALVEAALLRSPDARTAVAALDEARAVRQGQFRQIYIPSAPVTGSASRTSTRIVDQSGQGGFTQEGDSQNYGLNLDVSWELDVLGRRKAARGVIDNDLAAARFAYEGARAALAANVAQAWFEARGLAVQLEDARESVRIATSLADLSARRGERGLTATSEADRTAAELSQARAQVEDLQAQLQVARRTLLILVGRGVEPVASLPVAAALSDAPPIPAALPGDLLARRPDVREAQARLAASTANLKIAELALFPTFTLTPGVGLSRAVGPSFGVPGSTVSTTSSSWTLGAGLSVPLFNIPKLMSDIDAQDARVERAAVAYEKTVQTAYGEAEGALLRLAADQRRVALLQAGEARAQSAYTANRKGYAAGLTDLTAALQAEQSWRASRSALTGARTQALLRAVQTYKALGGGWSPEAAPPASKDSSQ
jgi:multidrug efflux system outer membrane protein